jgi:hypothetical protein
MQADVPHKPAKAWTVQTELIAKKIVQLTWLISTMERGGSGAALHP